MRISAGSTLRLPSMSSTSCAPNRDSNQKPPPLRFDQTGLRGKLAESLSMNPPTKSIGPLTYRLERNRSLSSMTPLIHTTLCVFTSQKTPRGWPFVYDQLSLDEQ